MKNENFSQSVVRSVVSSEDVVGVKVKNSQKEDLGKIEKIILEKLSGKVCYLVLSFGGILGIGDKHFAIPWNAIHYDPREDAFILDVRKEKLKKAPSFDKTQPPNFNDKNWGESIFNYYGTPPYWQ